MGRFSVVEADVLNGHALLWITIKDRKICGAVVTQIQETETAKVCEILACGGRDVRRWMHLLPTLEQYARMFGCSKVRFSGRVGWERVMTNYTVEKIVMERRL